VENGDLDAAIADFTAAIRLRPDFADAYHNRAVAYDEKARSDFARAEELGYDAD